MLPLAIVVHIIVHVIFPVVRLTKNERKPHKLLFQFVKHA